jgi:hypothetical protein
VSSIVTAPRRQPSRSGAATAVPFGGREVSIDLLVGIGLAAILTAVSFAPSGGVDLAPNTWVQIGLVLIAAGVIVALALLSPVRPLWGGWSVALFAGLSALTYASLSWSVQPSNSWLEANRTLSYLGAFVAAAGLARLWPGRWRAMIGGVAAAATVVSLYALIVKVFPATLDAGEQLARLRAPFDYWNAVGVMAAMGIPACLWAGSRRERAVALRALSVPAIAILITALLLSYSRGALIAAIVGTALWFALVPLRLRGAAILAAGAAAGAVLSGWALSNHTLTADGLATSARTGAGHTFGVLLLIVLVVSLAAGFAIVRALDRATSSPTHRHQLGTALVALVALVPVGGVVALAASSRGLTGEVSHIWQTLTNQNGIVGNSPGRLVQLSNSRPHYWHEALQVGEHHLVAGVGALGFATAQGQYTTGVWNAQHAHVAHAHGYLLQTFADFGLIGLVLTLALLVAWLGAAERALGLGRPFRRSSLRAPPVDLAAEQVGLVTVFSVVLIFGLHSLIDWTWFIPGTAVLALVCAGWLAGRGPLGNPVRRLPERRRLARSPGAVAVIAAAIVATVLAVWVIVQPLRSQDAYNSALNQLTRGHTATALTDARRAQTSNPLSVDPLFLQSAIYISAGNRAAARRALIKATSVQSSNPETWLRLGCFDLHGGQGTTASIELERAWRLLPGVPAIIKDPAQSCASIDI